MHFKLNKLQICSATANFQHFVVEQTRLIKLVESERASADYEMFEKLIFYNISHSFVVCVCVKVLHALDSLYAIKIHIASLVTHKRHCMHLPKRNSIIRAKPFN